jgi:hypothetical protein
MATLMHFLVFKMEIALRFQKLPTFSNFIGQNFIAKNKNHVVEWQLHP